MHKKNRLQQQTLDRYFRPRGAAPGVTQVPPSLGTAVPPAQLPGDGVECARRAHETPPAVDSARTGNRRHWVHGREAVIPPWSAVNTHRGANGQRCQTWDVLRGILSAPTQLNHSRDLCALLQSLEQVVDNRAGTYAPLTRTLEAMSAADRQHFLHTVLPWMTDVVLGAPALFADAELPLLVQGESRRLVLAHEEVVALMCCAFFSLFPQRSEATNVQAAQSTRPGSSSSAAASDAGTDGCWGIQVSRKLPSCNFSSLFDCRAVGRDASLESKIRGFLEYFVCCQRHHVQRATSAAYTRCVELTRASCSEFPRFDASARPLCAVSLCRTGGIEDDAAALQVDFANRVVGGGVLRSGCVQEEIRMTLAPEMVVSRIFCEELTASEVLFISGAPNFCHAVGYAEGFRYQGPRDPWGLPNEEALGNSVAPAPPLVLANALHPRTLQPMFMHAVCVVAMDAHNFRVRGPPSVQYEGRFLEREVRKAYVAFRGVDESLAALPVVRRGPIATGHWGCGAFCGNAELKLLLQWCAASEAGERALHYYTFDKPLRAFDDIGERLRSDRCTVGRLMHALVEYGTYRRTVSAVEPLSPLQYVAQHVCSTVID